MKICNTPSEFQEQLNDTLLDFLQTDFKDYVFETESEMVKKIVYSYRATDYAMHERRMDNGGLSDIRNMEAIVLHAAPGEGAVVYVNNTLPQELDYNAHPLSEAEAVETGNEDWNMSRTEANKGPGPREFTKATLHQIASGNKTYSVFKEYLGKKGIQTTKIK